MRSFSHITRSWLTLGALVPLVACTPAALPLRVQPLETSTPGLAPEVRIPVDAPMGTVVLTILWPERKDFQTQAIPLRTNAIAIQVLDSSNQVLAATTLTRPNAGSLPTTANLSVPAGPNRRLIVKAYQEQVPGFDSTPIAEGTATVRVDPSTEVTADLSLVPVTMPVIASMTSNAGPLATVTLTGTGFDGWGQPVEVRFGGIPSPFVTGTDTQLTAIVPQDAPSGPVTVTADGLTAQSSTSFTVIRSLELSPAAATGSPGVTLGLALVAEDAGNQPIPLPNVAWSFQQTYPLLPDPGSTPSTLVNGWFTPGSTGSYEIRVTAGSLLATASVTVN